MATTKKTPQDDPEESKRFIEVANQLGIAEDDTAFNAAIGAVRPVSPKVEPAIKTGSTVKTQKRKR